MACPNCHSINVTAQTWKEVELEELPDVYVKHIVLLCKDCKWGFNCSGTLDNRQKKPKPAV